MKRTVKRIAALVLAAALLAAVQTSAPEAEAAYTAPTDTIRVALYTNTSTKSYVSANLQNVVGHGYEFGYYNSDREFVSLGAKAEGTDKISMMMDRNMVYNSGSNSYESGSTGTVVVGCYHIKLNTAYDTYAEALSAAQTVSALSPTFVRYENGKFYAMCGQFVGPSDTERAADSLGVTDYTADSGSKYTVTVVETGTSQILFEFDCGTELNLAVHPLGGGSEKTLTYFKNIQYYGDFVYRRNTGDELTVINYVNIEDYVKGVVPSEMSPSWPLESLKAQAVCARTYAMANLNKHKSLGFDLCNTVDCQVYYGRRDATDNSDAAVDATAGQYVIYNGTLCETYFYSYNGGASENNENVWTGEALPYLRGKIDPYDAHMSETSSNYNWTVTLTGSEIAQKLRNKNYNAATIVRFEISQFTALGNVNKITLTDANGKTFTFTKETCRTVLGLRSIHYTLNGQSAPVTAGNDLYVNSSANVLSGSGGVYAVGETGAVSKLPEGTTYAISGEGAVAPLSVSVEESGTTPSVSSSGAMSVSGSKFTITGSGYGHNVGLSQWGAYSMAKYYNKNYIEILTFYYSGVDIVTAEEAA